MNEVSYPPTPLLTFLSLLLLPLAPRPSPAQTSLPEVVVTAPTTPSATAPSAAKQAKKELEQVPGGTNFITPEEFQTGKLSSILDVLDFQPGVAAFPQQGGAGYGLWSIRGSGLARPEPHIVEGLAILVDGLPINRADGAVHDPSVLDPGYAQYIQIWRGANALEYGSAYLGGAINLVSQNGTSFPGAMARLEGGSFGYILGQTAFGLRDGPVDQYLYLSEHYREGFQAHSAEQLFRIQEVLGCQPDPTLQSRWYFTYVNARVQLPGPLTLAQIEQDPSAANPEYAEGSFRIYYDYYRLANRTTVALSPDQTLETGLWWGHKWLWHPLEGIFLHGSDNDLGMLVNYRNRSDFAGHSHEWLVGLLPQGLYYGETDYNMAGPFPTQLASHSQAVATNLALYGQDRFWIFPELALVSGIQLDWAYRSNEATDFLGKTTSSTAKDYYGVNPKIGLLYTFSSEKSLFVNFSRSFQPPTLFDLVPASELLPPQSALFPLSAQRATTVEVGTRGQIKWAYWDFALYQSWVEDELLQSFLPEHPGFPLPLNVSPTIHRGVESLLDLLLWGDSRRQNHQPFALVSGFHLRQLLNWSDFRFAHDPLYGKNHLPVFPSWYYRAELLYETQRGFFIGPNLQAVFGHYPVDLANTLFAPPYATLGLTLGYATQRGFSFFFEGKNLTNEHYVSSVLPTVNAAGLDAPLFQPGDGWGLFGGIRWQW